MQFDWVESQAEDCTPVVLLSGWLTTSSDRPSDFGERPRSLTATSARQRHSLSVGATCPSTPRRASLFCPHVHLTPLLTWSTVGLWRETLQSCVLCVLQDPQQPRCVLPILSVLKKSARLPVEVSVESVTDLRLLVVNWH